MNFSDLNNQELSGLLKSLLIDNTLSIFQKGIVRTASDRLLENHKDLSTVSAVEAGPTAQTSQPVGESVETRAHGAAVAQGEAKPVLAATDQPVSPQPPTARARAMVRLGHRDT